MSHIDNRFAPRALLCRPPKIQVELSPHELADLIELLEARACRAAEDPYQVGYADFLFCRVAELREAVPMNALPAVTISDWKPLHRNTLRGFLTAHLPSGMTLHEVSVHCRDGTWWVSPASKPMIGADGTAMRDAEGKTRYSPVVSFESKTARARFTNAIIAALRLAHPEVFAGAEVAS